MAVNHPVSNRSRGCDLHAVEEIEEMVRRFYADVAQDDLLGPVFNDVAQVDWAAHIPKLVQFWQRILLSQPGYQGNPLAEHERIHAITTFTADHFNRWLDLFHDTVDDGWAGPNAEQAKAFAFRVAEAHYRHLNRIRG